MVESLGHARSRIMALCNVESLLDSDEHVITDALPHNVEASNVANEALVLDSAALNGIDAGLAPESTGVFCHFPVPLCTPMVAFPDARKRKTNGTLALLLRREGTSRVPPGVSMCSRTSIGHLVMSS